MPEALEGRCLLAVTGTTPVPFAAVETVSHTGNLMTFTANDAGPFTADIVWGDLTSSLGVPVVGGVVSGTHTYAEDGTYTVAVTIHDAADATAVANTTTATVAENGPLAVTGTNFTAPEGAGGAPVVVATFTDPGSTDAASNFGAGIDWGNGVVTPGVITGAAGAYTVTGVPPYSDEGTFTVTTAVSEVGQPASTSSGTSTATITEADAFTGGVVTVPVGSVEGVTVNGTVLRFNDTGFPGNTAADLNASINWGDGTVTPGTIVANGGGAFSVNGTHVYKEEGTFPLSVTVSDDAPGTASATFTGSVVIADAPLTAGPALTVSGTQGAPLTNIEVARFTDADVFGTATDFLATIDWGDGTPTTAGRVIQDAAGVFHVIGSHTYAEERATPYTITVNVLDNGDGRTVTDPSDSKVTVTTPATIVQSPLLPIASAVVATEGTAVAVGTNLASFTDTGGAGPVGDYTATVNWGDGTPTVPATVALSGNGGNFLVTAATAHTYAEDGTYPVTVTITDADAGPNAVPTTALTTSTATVADAALTASPTQPVIATVAEGQKFTGVVGSFTDANAGAPLSDYSAIIDWGDGSPTSLGSFTAAGGVVSINGSHVFKQEGAFTIRVLTQDVAGKQVTTTDTITVGDPNLTGAAAVAVRAVESQDTGPLVLAKFVDPDPNSTAHDWSAVVHWGDGTPDEPATVVLAGGDPASGGNVFKVEANHVFNEEGPPTSPTVTITDVDTAANTPTVVPLTIAVVDVGLGASSGQGASIQAIEGVPFTNKLVATFFDSNPNATAADFTNGGSVVVDWGDGTTSDLTSTPPVTITATPTPNGVLFSVFGAHTYAEEGSYQVTVTATDRGGSVSIAHGSATVADARLGLAAAQPDVTTTESPIFPVPVFGAPLFTGPVGTFTDTNPDAPVEDFTATIDWGDGTPQSAGTITLAGGAFTVTGSHTYADSGQNNTAGTYPITVYVVDEGGSRITIHNTANVNDTAIALTGGLNPTSDTGQSATDAITDVNQPNFTGTSEPFSHVTLFATQAGGAPVKIGAVQAGSDGSWSITADRLLDGRYNITATATDQFGKTITAAPLAILPNGNQGPLVIDTVGPRVVDVFFNRLNGEVDVIYQDDRSGLNQSSILDAANYELTRAHNDPTHNPLLVTNVTASGQALPTDLEAVRVTFNGGQPLRGGFYTFTIRDSTRGASTVRDVAGNSLDGEFYGVFPSGNGIPGGDFVARLDAIHNKVFAPQTTVGTANAANGGQGFLPFGPVHSGIFTHVVPRQIFANFGQGGLRGLKVTHPHVATATAHPHGPSTKVHAPKAHAPKAAARHGKLHI